MGRPPAGDASGLRALFRVGRTPTADSSCMVPPSAKHLSMSNLRSGRRRGFVMFDVGALCYHKARRGGQTLKVRRTLSRKITSENTWVCSETVDQPKSYSCGMI